MTVCFCGIPYEECCGARLQNPLPQRLEPHPMAWECPRCGRVNAPHRSSCGCEPPESFPTFMNTTGGPFRNLCD